MAKNYRELNEWLRTVNKALASPIIDEVSHDEWLKEKAKIIKKLCQDRRQYAKLD